MKIFEKGVFHFHAYIYRHGSEKHLSTHTNSVLTLVPENNLILSRPVRSIIYVDAVTWFYLLFGPYCSLIAHQTEATSVPRGGLIRPSCEAAPFVFY